MIKIGIIAGSTRPGRNGEAVSRRVHDHAVRRGDAHYELVDLKDYDLPHLFVQLARVGGAQGVGEELLGVERAL
ncbi:NADPH-dependent FMN reductase [Sphaerisporangium fuscum]|uniref:NADPH-dependent FMN reductase n=1 Tax=Sphaerisporangium fuscum TaxID=2835868 RepID=UPI001BDD0111|nr:NAD(P)H-dependent oxidoreductase [Sphaerisporangium fuscum]